MSRKFRCHQQLLCITLCVIIMMQILVVLFVCLLVCKSFSMQYKTLSYRNILSKSAIKVIENVDSGSFLTCISIASSNSPDSSRQHKEIINDIAGSVKTGISLISSDDGPIKIRRFTDGKSFILVVVDGLTSFRVLEKQVSNGKFNFDGHFLVVINNVTDAYMNIVNDICNIFFYDYVVNIQILIPNPLLQTEILMFTYFPYKPSNCSRANVELYNVFANDTFLEEKSHFPDKLLNFYNCTIVVAAFNTTPYVRLVTDKKGHQRMEGFEGQLFSSVAEVLNLNIKVIVPPMKWGAVNPNNTFTGALELVYNNTANITMGSFFYQSKNALYFDYTWSYHTSYLCIIIPSGRPFTALEKTMWPFQTEVWYTVLLIVALKFLIQMSIKIFPQSKYFDRIDILDYVRIYFGLCITQYPVKILSKMFVIGMFFYAMILRSCYQSSLFHFMTLMVNASTIHSVNELIKENFYFHLIQPLHFVLDSVPQIKSRAVFVTESVEHKLRHKLRNSWESKTAIITSRNHLFGEMIPIKENIYQLSIAMILRRNSYFTGVFNDVIYNLLANGYISRLYSNFNYYKVQDKPTSTGLLAMKDVIGLFRICFVGYVIAFAVFGLEITSVIFQRNKNKITKLIKKTTHLNQHT